MEWLESLRERPIELDELRNEVDQWLTWLDRRFNRHIVVNVLQEVLPLDHVMATSSIRRQFTALGHRLEAEQATDTRQHAEMTASVSSPDIPEASLVRAVGIDGGYLYLRLAGHRRRQDGWFEVIVGKSMRDQDAGHSFAYMHKLEHRPADRMLNFLRREGVQPSHR